MTQTLAFIMCLLFLIMLLTASNRSDRSALGIIEATMPSDAMGLKVSSVRETELHLALHNQIKLALS